MATHPSLYERPPARPPRMPPLGWPPAFPHVTLVTESCAEPAATLTDQLRTFGVIVRTLHAGLPDLARHLRPDVTSLLVMVLGAPAEDGPRLDSSLLDRLPTLGIPVIAALAGNADHYEPWLSLCADLLAPPFDGEELALRARVLAARRQSRQQHTLQVGRLVLDIDRYQVWYDGRALALSYKEFEILRLLMHTPDRVVTRELLLNAIWQDRAPLAPEVVDAHVRRLRKKLEATGSANLHTIRRRGFVLRSCAPTDASPASGR